MKPVLQLLIVVELAELTFDQLAFARVNMTVCLGRGHQGLENRLAVLLGLRHWQAIQGLRFGLRGRALLGLPVAVGFVGQHAQCGEAAINRDLASDLARLLVTQQQAHGPGGEGPAARTGEQAADATARPLVLRRTGIFLQQILARLEQLVEQSTGDHFPPPQKGLTGH
ncbi:hypothetical protein D3C76_1130210 [compost metagenome]